MSENEHIGTRLRRLRLSTPSHESKARVRGEQGFVPMSQRELACAGVSYAYISRIEAGARNPSVKALRRLAERLGVTPEYLESGTQPPFEQGIQNAGLTYAELTEAERQILREASDEAILNTVTETIETVIKPARAAQRRQELEEELAQLDAPPPVAPPAVEETAEPLPGGIPAE